MYCFFVYLETVSTFSFKFLQAFHLFGFEEFVYSAEVLAYAFVSEFVDLCHKSVKEIAVVADNDECAIVVLKGLFQHIFCL